MTKNSKPTHRAHIVRNYTDKDGTERSHWTDIGSVWPHGDGKGYDVTLWRSRSTAALSSASTSRSPRSRPSLSP